MNKRQTIGDILSDPPCMSEPDFVKEVRQKLKKLDAYEGFCACEECGEMEKESDLYPNDDGKWICKRCLEEEEEEKRIIREEEINHHK